MGARFRDGIRETLTEIDSSKSIQNVLKEGWTLQVHQPQRYVDNLWRLLSSLESEFGSLVGCNSYITPGNCSQGLAPHYDDVSIFCCQIYGTKKWKIHNANPCLANHPSGDILTALGKPFMEVELKPGDILYLPRGTIHHASTNDSQSTHLTISFLQKWSFIDLLAKSLEACTVLPPLQISLPDSLKQTIYSIDDVESLKVNASHCLGHLSDYLRNSSSGLGVITNGLNAMKYDFMINRLPPHPEQVHDKGPQPNIDDEISLLGNFFHLFKDLSGELKTKPKGDGSVDISFASGYDLRIMTSLYNSKEHHMMSSGTECCDEGHCEHELSESSTEGDNDSNGDDTEEKESSDEEDRGQSSMLLPQCFESVLDQIFSGIPVRVIDLDLDSDQKKLDIAKAFHDFGLCRTIPRVSKKRKL